MHQPIETEADRPLWGTVRLPVYTWLTWINDAPERTVCLAVRPARDVVSQFTT